MVGIAAHVVRAEDGRCTSARVAGCGLGSTPVDLSVAVGALVGQAEPTDAVLREVAAAVDNTVDPPSDVHADADDRRELAQLLTVEALRVAWERAR